MLIEQFCFIIIISLSLYYYFAIEADPVKVDLLLNAKIATAPPININGSDNNELVLLTILSAVVFTSFKAVLAKFVVVLYTVETPFFASLYTSAAAFSICVPAA